MVPGMNERGLKRLYLALINSIRGLCFAARHESALRQELLLLVAAVPVAAFMAPGLGWFVAMISVLLILPAVELLNTAVEKLADHVMPEFHPQIKVVKDIGSAAVLFALLLAGLVWAGAVAERFDLIVCARAILGI